MLLGDEIGVDVEYDEIQVGKTVEEETRCACVCVCEVVNIKEWILV